MRDSDELSKSVRRRYASEEDIDVYRDRALQGLRAWETAVVNEYMSPSRVLNVGCGGGRESFALEALGYAPTGIDIVKVQIDSARTTAQRIESAAIFVLYDGVRIPFADGTFGAVTIWSQVLGNVAHSSRRLELLRETHRVLNSGGVLSLSVHDYEKTMAILERSNEIKHRKLQTNEHGDLMYDECYWHYFDSDEVAALCQKAGFAQVSVSTSKDLGQEWDNLLIAVCIKP